MEFGVRDKKVSRVRPSSNTHFNIIHFLVAFISHSLFEWLEPNHWIIKSELYV